MTSSKKRYPRRAEHGDPTPTCEWCGKRVQIGRMWREYGIYCSNECEAAERHDTYLGLFVVALTVSLVSFGSLLLGTVGMLPLPTNAALFWVMMLIVGCFCVYHSNYMYNLGGKVIAADQMSITKDELEDISSTILDVVQTNQTEKGVTRKVLYADLRSYGFSNRAIKSGIEYLLVTEKLRQIGLNHYVTAS